VFFPTGFFFFPLNSASPFPTFSLATGGGGMARPISRLFFCSISFDSPFPPLHRPPRPNSFFASFTRHCCGPFSSLSEFIGSPLEVTVLPPLALKPLSSVYPLKNFSLPHFSRGLELCHSQTDRDDHLFIEIKAPLSLEAPSSTSPRSPVSAFSDRLITSPGLNLESPNPFLLSFPPKLLPLLPVFRGTLEFRGSQPPLRQPPQYTAVPFHRLKSRVIMAIIQPNLRRQ